ncbi:Rieske 2Fe-2S domain-containing protein [Desertifilum sp. FACHB-868]|nr:Rieske 2Fe-2S domain-containing protein [Desertifilum sp. FACHB-868]
MQQISIATGITKSRLPLHSYSVILKKVTKVKFKEIHLKDDNTLDNMGIVDNCTHLGCTFPWNSTDQQFQCPCHGSLYAPDGTVVRGPAPLPLKIVRVAVVDNSILISPWTETDPRTGEKPWWV